MLLLWGFGKITGKVVGGVGSRACNGVMEVVNILADVAAGVLT